MPARTEVMLPEQSGLLVLDVLSPPTSGSILEQ